MLSRKNRIDAPTYLPEEWREEVKNLLDGIYKAELLNLNKTFIVHGASYVDEICIAVSLLDRNDALTSPVAYKMSADLEKETNAKKIIAGLVDSVGVFFDQYFATAEWSDYQTRWEETEFSKLKFHYQISRENIALSIIGDELLKTTD